MYFQSWYTFLVTSSGFNINYTQGEVGEKKPSEDGCDLPFWHLKYHLMDGDLVNFSSFPAPIVVEGGR